MFVLPMSDGKSVVSNYLFCFSCICLPYILRESNLNKTLQEFDKLRTRALAPNYVVHRFRIDKAKNSFITRVIKMSLIKHTRVKIYPDILYRSEDFHNEQKMDPS